jgi:hypothetical protein
MNLSRLLDLIRSRPAVLVAAALILMLLLGLSAALRPRTSAPRATLYTNAPPGPTTVYERPPAPILTVQPKPAPTPPPIPVRTPPPTPAPAPPPVPIVAPAPVVPTNKPLIGVSYHAKLPPETNAPGLGLYAPAGRLLRCRLVNTVDSANIDTPIIALVTDDLWHEGKLVIPAGTEVHGKASVDRLRERIVASGAWNLVWQSGEELVVDGIALDREENQGGDAWGITDGSAGLRGQILRSDSLAEIKLFIATFMAGAASGLKEQRTTLLGDQIARTVQNGALEGAGQVISSYAKQMLETIQREGIFVRVAAGKEMYLYVTGTIDGSLAKKGNLRVATMPASPFAHPTTVPVKP